MRGPVRFGPPSQCVSTEYPDERVEYHTKRTGTQNYSEGNQLKSVFTQQRWLILATVLLSTFVTVIIMNALQPWTRTYVGTLAEDAGVVYSL